MMWMLIGVVAGVIIGLLIGLLGMSSAGPMLGAGVPPVERWGVRYLD